MDIRYVESSELFAVSAIWLDPKQERSKLESKDATRGLLPLMETAHKGLQRAVQTEEFSTAELEKARKEADDLDDLHDDLYRGTFYLLTAQAAFSPERRELLLELRDYLFPDGLAGVNKAYLTESGEVGLLSERLTPEKRSLLQSVVVDSTTHLLMKVEQLIKVGAALGLAEKKKQDLLQLQSEMAPLSRSEINQTKNDWLIAAKTFMGAIQLSSFSKSEKKALLQPFVETEQKVLARIKSRSEAKRKAEEEAKKKADEAKKKAEEEARRKDEGI